MRRITGLVLCYLLVACSRPNDEATKTADALKSLGSGGGAADDTSNNPVCKLFSSADAAKYIGEDVGSGHNATGGCQWSAANGHDDVMVTIHRAEDHEVPDHAPDYKPLPDIGSRGYVARDYGGHIASAIIGKNSVWVEASGPASTEATTIALLKEAIKRYGGSAAQ